MMGGQAIAEALWGELNPSGRLPYSLYTEAAVSAVSPMRMDMRPDSADVNPAHLGII